MVRNEKMKNLKSKNPMDFFFSLGDKVTKGDAQRKAMFDYYLMWIMFLAFLMIMFSNLNSFLVTGRYSYLGWAFVILAICWFQYWSLRMAREARIMMAKQNPGVKYNEVEDMDEMLKVTSKKGGNK